MGPWSPREERMWFGSSDIFGSEQVIASEELTTSFTVRAGHPSPEGFVSCLHSGGDPDFFLVE
jgi:hypothetical protein